MLLAKQDFGKTGNLPLALFDLSSELELGGEEAPPEVLGPVSVLEEVQLTCESVMSGREINRANLVSLIDDLRVVRDHLGAKLLAAAGPAADDFFRRRDKLISRLATGPGARSVSLGAASFQEALRRPSVSVAAWQDAVKAFSDANKSPAECLLRVRFLRELCEARGHRWDSLGLASRLVAVLRDFEGHARAESGEAQELTPVKERLSACEALIAAEPRRADTAVWMVVTNAALENAYLRVGPVQFFERSVLPRAAAEGGWLYEMGFERLPELADWEDFESSLSNLPDEHVVLARVWLRGVSVTQAPERARQVLESLIEVSRPNSAWKLYAGYQAWSGAGFGGSSFDDPVALRVNSGAIHPVFERTAESLGEFEPALVQKLVDGDPGVAEAIEDARWAVAVDRASTLEQRIALGTRALERTLGLAQSKDERWSDAARRYLRDAWVDWELTTNIHHTGWDFTHRFPDKYTANKSQYEEAHDLVAPESAPGRRLRSMPGMAEAWTRYGALWDEKALAARAMAETDRILNDPRAGLLELRRLARRFDQLLARTERQRNAIIHGTRASRGVLASVEFFISTLNHFMASESVRTAETQRPPLSRFEQSRIDALEWQQRLAGGEPLIKMMVEAE